MVIATPEITLAALDSGALSEMLASIDAEIDAVSRKIAALSKQKADRNARLTELESQLESSQLALAELAKERDLVQEKYNLAEKAREVSATTPAKAATEAHAAHWEEQLRDLEQQYEAAAKQTAEQEARAEKEQETLLLALTSDEGELRKAQQERQLLQKSRETTNAERGQATLREIAEKYKELRGYEEALTMVLSDTQTPIYELQEDIPQLLAPWPDLLQKAMRLYGPPRKETETEALLKAYLAFLAELEELSKKGTKFDGEFELAPLLSISEHDIRLALNAFAHQGVYGNVGQRIRNVENRLREHQDKQQRAWDGRYYHS